MSKEEYYGDIYYIFKIKGYPTVSIYKTFSNYRTRLLKEVERFNK